MHDTSLLTFAHVTRLCKCVTLTNVSCGRYADVTRARASQRARSMRHVIALSKAFVLPPTRAWSEGMQDGKELEFYLTARRMLTEEAARCAITIIKVSGILAFEPFDCLAYGWGFGPSEHSIDLPHSYHQAVG